MTEKAKELMLSEGPTEAPTRQNTPVKPPKNARQAHSSQPRQPSKRWPTRTIEQRFWDHVDKSGECWNWTAYKIVTGYGLFNIRKGKWEYAHRMAYIFTHSSIPWEKHVLHTCDNPACCNPAHLWIGTHADNMGDKARKGRASRSRAKLTWEAVDEIRKSDKPPELLSLIYGVSPRSIQLVLNKTTWNQDKYKEGFQL